MSIFARLKQFYHRLVARVVAVILRPGATSISDNFELWQRQNYHILPLHFHSPIPDTRELATSQIWSRPRELLGLDWNLDCQIKHLTTYLPIFGQEFADFLTSRQLERYGFFLDNNAYPGTDPAILYSMVRYYRPNLVVEIGSGYSSRLMAAALTENEKGKMICIDPYPDSHLCTKLSEFGFSVIQEKVERLQPKFFDALEAGDMLFIDSTHAVRIGGDVNFLFLEVLPRLRPGVLVHIHDIFLPEEYPREWVIEKHIFWGEQYILHAFLLFNRDFEVLLATNFLAQKYPDLLRRCFPGLLWWGGSSFWIRRMPK